MTNTIIKNNRKIFIVLLISAFVFLFMGCENNSKNTDTNEKLLAPIASNTFFNSAIKNNCIDSLYETELEKGESYSSAVNNYTLMWIDEFDYTVSQYKSFFTEEEFVSIKNDLENWSKNEKSIWQWERSIIFEDSKSKYGTQNYDDE